MKKDTEKKKTFRSYRKKPFSFPWRRQNIPPGISIQNDERDGFSYGIIEGGYSPGKTRIKARRRRKKYVISFPEDKQR
ncbi:MAG: hypothetical protein J6S47_00130, partial [Eubacteriaceae bacterium]|nr:hypothetical protein [Eubacteriaceae bacterium]